MIFINSNHLHDCPELLRNFLVYLETIKGLSSKTAYEYFLDIRTFLRFMKAYKNNLNLNNIIFDEIKINDINADFISTISLSDVYEYLHYINSSRENGSAARSRKVSAIRGFFKYLTTKANILKDNPVKELEVPNLKKSLPRYLTLEESLELLNSVPQSEHQLRDYCIITLFLNCGMRLSELVGINLRDIKDNTVKICGKGNKERIVYLNDSCMSAINDYLKVRPNNPKEKNALFISRNGNRISRRRVQNIVEDTLKTAGLSDMGYSTHKLRHTAATLLYQHGDVDIRVLKEMLGHKSVATTEIYTHVSDKQLENASKSSPLSNVKNKKQKPKID